MWVLHKKYAGMRERMNIQWFWFLWLSVFPALYQREERKMLRELKVFLDQLERDVLRAQGAEGNLTDKYQVSHTWWEKVAPYWAGLLSLPSDLPPSRRLSRTSACSTKWRRSRRSRCCSRCTEMGSCPWTKRWSNRRGTGCLPGWVHE